MEIATVITNLHSNMDRLKPVFKPDSADAIRDLHSNMDRLKQCFKQADIFNNINLFYYRVYQFRVIIAIIFAGHCRFQLLSNEQT